VSPARRWALTAAVGALAAAAGAAWFVQRRGAQDAGSDELWSLEFETPAGGQLALASFRGRPVVLNFWATWCPPCVREMPLLDRFARDHAAKGWQVVGIAADEATPVQTFLARQPVSFAIGLAGFAGVGLSRRLGNLSGGLPFTVILGRDGTVAHRHMGELRHEQLAAWAEGIS
jgi:thiol-disulfide isomerase/thioredoxin